MNCCPLCSKPVDSFHETDVETPFTHYSPMIGLSIWGPLGADKEVICQDKQFVHFVFAGAEHRLVQLAVPKPALDFDNDEILSDDDDDYWLEEADYDECDEEDFPNGSLDY